MPAIIPTMAYPHQTETLNSKDIEGVSEGNDEFGSDTSLLVARPGRPSCCCSFPLFWFTVPEGFYALITKHGARVDYTHSDGTKTCVWPAGLHIGSPFLKVSHMVTKQSMIFNTPIRGCKTKDNVSVNIDICIVLRVMGDKDVPGDDPENVYNFVHMVTAKGLEQQLNDAQAEAIRTLARSVYHTEVFGLRSVSTEELVGVQGKLFGSQESGALPDVLEMADEDQGLVPIPAPAVEETKTSESFRSEQDDSEAKDLEGEHDELDPLEAGFNTETGASVTSTMRDRLNRQFKPQGVEILDVIIQQITLPSEIEKQMSTKTMVISQNAEQRMTQKFDMQNLTHTEAIKTLKQSQAEARMEAIKDGEYAALQEDLLLKEAMANGEKASREIYTKMVVDVGVIQSESNLEVQRIKDRTTLDVQKIKESSEADAEVTQVVAAAKIAEIKAEAELKCAQNETTGDKALFKAEGICAPKNRTLNEFLTKQQQLEAQTALATNDKLIVTGTDGGDGANHLILADAALRDASKRKGDKLSDRERSSILSELAVASGNARISLNMWDAPPPAPTAMAKKQQPPQLSSGGTDPRTYRFPI